MALVVCPDCSKPVSDKAEQCPSCGSPIASLVKKIPPEKVNCSECKKEYPFSDNTCPYCGLFNGKKRIFNNPLEKYNEPPSQAYVIPGVSKSRGITILLALFLGGIGAHKFYLEKPSQGFLYLLFCWTLIPCVFGFLEAINYFIIGKKEFERLYST